MAMALGMRMADILLPGREGCNLPAQNEGAENQPVDGDGLALDIFQDHAFAAIGGLRIQQRLPDRLRQCLRGTEHHIRHHGVKLFRLVFAQGRAFEMLWRLRRNRRQEGQRDLREQLARINALSREKGVNCAPSMRTGTILAFAIAATAPAPRRFSSGFR